MLTTSVQRIRTERADSLASFLAAFLLSVLLSLLGASQTVAANDNDRWIVNLQFENDRFVNTDRHYTHGMRAAIVPPASYVPQWATWLSSNLLGVANSVYQPGNKTRLGFALGYNIFTPDDISQRGLIVDDRPYAGWLYGGLALHAETETRLDSIELNLGLVGPSAHAEDIQVTFHEWINSTRPQGWDNQLENEPTIMLIFERKVRIVPRIDMTVLELDAVPYFGFALGNVYTFADVGAFLRIGGNMPDSFGPPRMKPSLSGNDSFDDQEGFGWYFYFGGEARAVARNIFIDGNTFSQSHSVSKKPFVGDIQGGIVLAWGPVRLAYTHVYRTREYHEQPNPDRFGGLSLGIKLRF